MQFVFPIFLWALVGVAIPIVLHLLQLRRPQRIQFTNTGFIQDIEFKNGRRRLQDLLVLVLRILAVVFLVLTFSQPFFSIQSAATTSGNRELAVFVDSSPSMQLPGNTGGSLVQHASDATKQLINSYGANAHLRLVGKKHSRLATEVIANETNLLQPRQQAGWGTNTTQRELQVRAGGPFFVFSDFQRSETPSAGLKQLSTTREIVLVPQSRQSIGNVYVDSVWLNDAFVRVRANIALHIRLKNGGQEAMRDCAVKVLLGKQQVAAFQTSIAQAQTSETVVQVQLPQEQLVKGEIVLGDSPVTFDNHYYFVLRPTTAIRVVEIGSAPLAQIAYQREPLFQYHYSKPEQVNFGQVQQANLVLIDEAMSIEADLRGALLEVVKRGGSVVIIPPAKQGAQKVYEQLLRTLGAGGAHWENSVVAPVMQELAMPDLRASFFREVFGAQPRQVALPEASPVLQLNGNGTDILRLRDGRGFLTEIGANGGKVYVFSTPFDQKYTNFSNHALFVPVLYRLAMLSYREDQTLAYRIGAKELSLPMPATQVSDKKETVYRLVQDSLALIAAQRQSGQQVRLELPAELSEPGFYQLRRGEQLVSTLAFNQTKRESELSVYSAAELRQLVGPNHPNVHVLDEDDQLRALGQYQARQTGQPLWRYCLLLALGCLLAESAVLRWGRQMSEPVAIAN